MSDVHDLSLQLAETRGELRELILDVRAEQRTQDHRLRTVEGQQISQWRRLDELDERTTTTTAIRRTWAAAGTAAGALLGVSATVLGAALL